MWLHVATSYIVTLRPLARIKSFWSKIKFALEILFSGWFIPVMLLPYIYYPEYIHTQHHSAAQLGYWFQLNVRHHQASCF
jgi:hypothetical protein